MGKKNIKNDDVDVIVLKKGQGISLEVIEDALGPQELDTGDLGEPDSIVERDIVFISED